MNLEKGFTDVIKNLWVGYPRLLGGLYIQEYLLLKDTWMGNREEQAEVMEGRGRDWRGGAKGERAGSPQEQRARKVSLSEPPGQGRPADNRVFRLLAFGIVGE